MNNNRKGPSIYSFLTEGNVAKFNPYTDEHRVNTIKTYHECVEYMKQKEILNYKPNIQELIQNGLVDAVSAVKLLTDKDYYDELFNNYIGAPN